MHGKRTPTDGFAEKSPLRVPGKQNPRKPKKSENNPTKANESKQKATKDKRQITKDKDKEQRTQNEKQNTKDYYEKEGANAPEKEKIGRASCRERV